MKTLALAKTMMTEQQAIVDRCIVDRSKLIEHSPKWRKTGGIIDHKEAEAHYAVRVLKTLIGRAERG